MEFKKTFVVVLILVALSSFNVYQLVLRKSPVLSVSAVQAGASIGIYWDNGCMQLVSSIEWGNLTAGETQDVVVYVRNEGNGTIILDLTTGNWQPGNASLWLDFSWSCPNTASIVPGQVVQVTQTLSVASDVPSGLSNFSFDIVAYDLAEHPSIVVRGMDDRIYYRVWNETCWEGWNVLPGSTIDSPAAAVLGNQLYVVVRGSDGNSLWYGYLKNITNPGSFSGWFLLSGVTSSAPTLASNGTTLCLVVRGMDNRIYYRVYNTQAQAWQGWNALPSGATCNKPAATMLGSTLYIVVRGYGSTDASMNNTLWYSTMNLTNNAFSGWTLLSGATPSSPTLTTSQTSNSLYLTVRGNDNRIYLNTWNGGNWQGWNALPTGTTMNGPAATIVGGKLYFVVVGMDGTSMWQSSLDLATSNPSGWTLLSGATPSAPTLTS